MKYTQYIVKKRYKQNAIDGYVNLPYGTLCDVIGEFIYWNAQKICAITSQSAFDFFWGYDSENPKEEINRQKLSQELFNLTPNESGDKLADKKNPWTAYGEFVERGFNTEVWQWNKRIFNLPSGKLQYLITCIKKGERLIV